MSGKGISQGEGSQGRATAQVRQGSQEKFLGIDLKKDFEGMNCSDELN